MTYKNKYFLLVLLLIVILTACEKEDKNDLEAPSSEITILQGNNQSGFFGELLENSIIIQASSEREGARFMLKYQMIQGNGYIDKPEGSLWNDQIELEKNGKLEFEWSLGCDFTNQQIQLFLYVDSASNYNGARLYYSSPSSSIIITASGESPSGWGKSCGFENIDPIQTKIISHNENLLYLINTDLYYSEDMGINWSLVKNTPNWNKIVDAQFNSLGWMYVLTYDKGICYTKDFKTWEYINNGIIDSRYPDAFLVEDSTLFVSFTFDGLYRSRDNGGFWRKLLVGNAGTELHHINRHPSGDLYLFDKWGILWKSTNDGDSWIKLAVEHQYIMSPIFDMKIDNEGLIYIGASEATISVISPETYTGDIHSFYEMNHSSQHVEDINFYKNIAYFTVNGNPRPGIFSSQNWNRLNLNFEDDVSNYYIKDDGDFIIISKKGIYYYTK